MLPVLLKTDWLILYSYPLFLGVAWGLGYNLSRYYISRFGYGLKGFKLFFWANLIVSWVGAKLFFLLFSFPNIDQSYRFSSSFWLGGGFVFYGGFLFSLVFSLSLVFGLKRFDYRNLPLLTPAIAVGHGVGRLGCFLAGCCYGTQCELPWSVYLQHAERHPVQLYEVTALFILALCLHKLIRARLNGYFVASFYIAGYAVIRFALEFFRGDKIRGLYAGLSTSQWVSLGMILFSLLFLYFARKSLLRRSED
jgi:phosphatidylglycerol:prolipoprotein diacylglycerol transferase